MPLRSRPALTSATTVPNFSTARSHALDGADEATTTLDAPLFHRHAAHLSAAHALLRTGTDCSHWRRRSNAQGAGDVARRAAELEASGAAYASLALVKIADRGDAAAGRDQWEHSLPPRRW